MKRLDYLSQHLVRKTKPSLYNCWNNEKLIPINRCFCDQPNVTHTLHTVLCKQCEQAHTRLITNDHYHFSTRLLFRSISLYLHFYIVCVQKRLKSYAHCFLCCWQSLGLLAFGPSRKNHPRLVIFQYKQNPLFWFHSLKKKSQATNDTMQRLYTVF